MLGSLSTNASSRNLDSFPVIATEELKLLGFSMA